MGRGTKSKTLADLLPRAAQMYGAAPAIRFKDGEEWVDRSFDEVGETVRAARARPDRPRRRQGRQGLDPRQHPAGVDLLRLRRPLDRRDRGPDLPDQLARGVPVRARELRRQGRRRRGRRAAREDPRGPRPAAAARARRADDRLERRRDLASRTSPRAAPAATASEWEARWQAVDPGRHLHLHLHLGHHRPAQGLRDQPRQLPLDARHGQRDERRRGRRPHLPLPAPRPLLRAADPARQLRPRRARSPTGSATR